MAGFNYPSVFYVEHIELDKCEKFQLNRTYGVAFPILTVNNSTTMGPIGLIFFVKHLHIIASYSDKFHVSNLFQLTAI